VPDVFDACKACLEEFKKARQAVVAEDLPLDMIANLEGSLDDVAILLEKHVPGKVQEILGETKIKYLAYGDCLYLHPGVKEKVSSVDMRSIGDVLFATSFIIRSAMFAFFFETGSGAEASFMLYDQPEVFGHNCCGWLKLKKSGEGKWLVEEAS
jgi:hypothetical protein